MISQALSTSRCIFKSLGRLQLALVLGEGDTGYICYMQLRTFQRVIPLSLGASLAAVFSGITVTRLGAYRAIIWVAWALMVVGWGLMTTLDDRSNT